MGFLVVVIFVLSFINLGVLLAIARFLPNLADQMKELSREPPEIVSEPEGGLVEVQPSAPYNRLSEIEAEAE